MSVLWAVGIFFSPSSAVRALFFLSYLKERGTSFSPSSVRHVEKIEHFQARKRTIFFFDEETTRDTTFFSLSLVPPLWRSHSHTIDIDYLIGRVTTQCEDLSRCSSDNDHHRRDRQRRESLERGKEERKKKTFGSDARDEGVQKLIWVRYIFFSFMKFFEALKRKRTSRITQQPGRARVR